jgi:hypothetical protein
MRGRWSRAIVRYVPGAEVYESYRCIGCIGAVVTEI